MHFPWPEFHIEIKDGVKTMTKAEFLKMQSIDQELIVLAEFPDFKMRAYDDTCFGIF